MSDGILELTNIIVIQVFHFYFYGNIKRKTDEKNPYSYRFF